MSIQKLNVRDHTWQVIINPNACDQKCFANWEAISKKFQKLGIEHVMHKSDRCGRGIEIARQLCQEGYRHLIVIGGDGTINEVVNGIFTSGVNTREVFLTILPLGRGNDWARTHHFPFDCLKSIDIMVKGNFVLHDIGKVETLHGGEVTDSRYFINIAGFGFDADVIYDTVYNKPHFLGISVYMLSLVRMLFKYKCPTIRIKGDDFEIEGKTFMTEVANCQYNGGGMLQAPMAKVDDGLLDVVFIPKVWKMRVVANIRNLFKGKHIERIRCIKTYTTKSLTITSKERVNGEVEGELLSVGDYRITLQGNALNTLTAIE